MCGVGVGKRERMNIALEKSFSITVSFRGSILEKGFIFSEAFYFYKITSSVNYPQSEVNNSYFVDYHGAATLM